jgi:hypothetical protein
MACLTAGDFVRRVRPMLRMGLMAGMVGNPAYGWESLFPPNTFNSVVFPVMSTCGAPGTDLGPIPPVGRVRLDYSNNVGRRPCRVSHSLTKIDYWR